MRISDWSSDVCSSDLVGRRPGDDQAGGHREQQGRDLGDQPVADGEQAVGLDRLPHRHAELGDADREAADRVDQGEIGRAAGRERVGKYVWMSVVAVSVQKKKKMIT